MIFGLALLAIEGVHSHILPKKKVLAISIGKKKIDTLVALSSK